MLVLVRKKYEEVIFPGPINLLEGQIIKIVVVEIKGDKVRLGIDAPAKEVPCIHRGEVWEQIKKPND